MRPDVIEDYRACAAERAHLAVSAILHLFKAGSMESAETAELEALHEFIGAELQDRQRRKDNDFPDYLDGVPF